MGPLNIKNLFTFERIAVYVIVTTAACITGLGVIKNYTKETIQKPIVKVHDENFKDIHKPIFDTLTDHGKRICNIEKKQKRYQSLFFAQYSDNDIERIRKRALEIEKRDSLFE